MKRFLLLLFLLAGLFSVVPTLGFAECTNLGNFDRFVVENGNTVVLYLGPIPVGRFDVQSCDVFPSSQVQLIKADVCDGDEIMIDGVRCRIMEIKPLGP